MVLLSADAVLASVVDSAHGMLEFVVEDIDDSLAGTLQITKPSLLSGSAPVPFACAGALSLGAEENAVARLAREPRTGWADEGVAIVCRMFSWRVGEGVRGEVGHDSLFAECMLERGVLGRSILTSPNGVVPELPGAAAGDIAAGMGLPALTE